MSILFWGGFPDYWSGNYWSVRQFCPLCCSMANSEPLWLHAGKALCCTFGLQSVPEQAELSISYSMSYSLPALLPAPGFSPSGWLDLSCQGLHCCSRALLGPLLLCSGLLFRFPSMLVELVSFGIQLAPGSPYLSSSKAPPGLLQKLQP